MNFSRILDEGKGTQVEFTESMNEHGFRAISAFSNTSGGSLFCGVSDKGDVTGFDCSEKSVRTIPLK